MGKNKSKARPTAPEATKPKATHLDMIDGRYSIVEVSAVEVAFPGNVKHLMPKYDGDGAFRRGWAADLAQRWFYYGLSEGDLPTPKEGVDLTMALRHMGCVLRSFEPKHEHKMECIAKLFANWFCEPTK